MNIEDLDRKMCERFDSLEKIIGDGPDSSTGRPGHGMRGQLAEVIQKVNKMSECRKQGWSMKNWTAKEWGTFVAAIGALITGIILAISQAGCAYTKPACDVIDIANTTCDYVVLKSDTGTVRVPKSTLKLAIGRDGGTISTCGQSRKK